MSIRLNLLALLLGLSLSPAGALEAQVGGGGNDRWIEVTGEGGVSAPADFARLTFGVTTTAQDARDAMAANAKSANELVSLLKSDGVAPSDLQTSDISITPIFTQPSSSQPSVQPITGYTVTNSVTATVRDISRLGALLDKAVAAGANTIYGISFGQNDPSALLDKARPLAVADARRKAEIYAGAAGAKIGPLMQLTEEAGARPIAFTARTYSKAASAPTPIESGEDKITATVRARFELTQ
jgi:uncharacterized protein YggE